MKLRFLAATGPAPLRAQLAERLQHEAPLAPEAALANDWLSLWVEPTTPFLTDSTGDAVLIGLLFDRSGGKNLDSLPDWKRLERILLRDFWGSYVLLTRSGTCHSVLRDPSGAVPVYYGHSNGLQLYASDAAMLRPAWAQAFSPDLHAVRHWLKYPFLRTARTGAAAITELLPGMIRQVGGTGPLLRQMWSAQSFALSAPPMHGFADAVALLRETILRSVPPLARGGSQIVLQLSGGLDSSILAAALAQGGVGFRAVTFATRSSDGDERHYARLVARHLGVDLEELGERDLETAPRMAANPLRPPPSPLLQPLRQALTAAAGTDALLLDGGGGDNVFAAINSAAPAIDALRRQGVAAGLRTLGNIAARHGCTVWTAGAAALRRSRKPAMIGWPADDRFLSPGGSLDQPEPHPWLSPSAELLPGSADHLRMIVGIHHFFADPGPGQPCNLHPLISQPMLELCLGMPSWLWSEGGRDRAVARAAFRGMLPDAIIERRGKGSLESLFVKGFAALRSRLREDLVGGRLVEEGIIDRVAVEAYLGLEDEPRDTHHVRLFEIAACEQWLRSFG